MLVTPFHLGCAETWRVTHACQSLLPMTRPGHGLGTCLARSPRWDQPLHQSSPAKLSSAEPAGQGRQLGGQRALTRGKSSAGPYRQNPTGGALLHTAGGHDRAHRMTRGTLHTGGAALPPPRCLREDGRQPEAQPWLELAPCFGDFFLSRG